MCLFGERDSWRKDAGTTFPDESTTLSSQDGRSLLE